MERTFLFYSTFQTWFTDAGGYFRRISWLRGMGLTRIEQRKVKKSENEISFKKKKKEGAYLESLQTTVCCGGALPTLVTLHAAVQTTAVVRLIQTLFLLKNNSCII